MLGDNDSFGLVGSVIAEVGSIFRARSDSQTASANASAVTAAQQGLLAHDRAQLQMMIGLGIVGVLGFLLVRKLA